MQLPTAGGCWITHTSEQRASFRFLCTTGMSPSVRAATPGTFKHFRCNFQPLVVAGSHTPASNEPVSVSCALQECLHQSEPRPPGRLNTFDAISNRWWLLDHTHQRATSQFPFLVHYRNVSISQSRDPRDV